jgi:hypothetical protein
MEIVKNILTDENICYIKLHKKYQFIAKTGEQQHKLEIAKLIIIDEKWNGKGTVIFL